MHAAYNICNSWNFVVRTFAVVRLLHGCRCKFQTSRLFNTSCIDHIGQISSHKNLDKLKLLRLQTCSTSEGLDLRSQKKQKNHSWQIWSNLPDAADRQLGCDNCSFVQAANHIVKHTDDSHYMKEQIVMSNVASKLRTMTSPNQGKMLFSLFCSHQSSLFATSFHTHYQLRFYRGRSRNQLLQPMTTDEDLSKDASFEKDIVSFRSNLQESGKEFDENLLPMSVDEMTIPEMSRHVCNLVPYVSRSETLQNLVKLGVNLDVVQRVEGVAELLLQSQFDRDIAPLIHLLNLAGVPVEAMGLMITRNPLLLTQSVEDLSSRIGYLLHKKFSQADVASIVTRAPVTLLMDPVKVDSKLAFLQTTFSLTGHEVRSVVLKYPKLIPWRRDMIANVRFHLQEFLAFSKPQLKELLLKEPKIYLTSPNRLTEVFDYLHTSMGITRNQMLVWPSIFRTRPYIIRDRHLFLLALGRAQYDPCLENFVSLKVLGSSRDSEFCRNVAKCEEAEFHAFLKTL